MFWCFFQKKERKKKKREKLTLDETEYNRRQWTHYLCGEEFIRDDKDYRKVPEDVNVVRLNTI